MKEKPDVLSDEKILEVSQITRENLEEGDDGYLTTRCNVAKAQRDADVAYYEPIIKQAKQEGYKQGVKDQYECQQIDLEQAKAEVAGEIFEVLFNWVIERRLDLQAKKVDYESSKPKEVQSIQVIGGKIKAFQKMINKLQSLKSKYLKEKKSS